MGQRIIIFQRKLFSPTPTNISSSICRCIYLFSDSTLLFSTFFLFFPTALQSPVPQLPPRHPRSVFPPLLSPPPPLRVCSGTPLIQRPNGTSYLRSVGFNQTPIACRHIPSSKKTKGRVAVGRVSPPPPSASINLLIMTLTETVFFSFYLPRHASIFCSPSLSSHVFNIPLALSFPSPHGSLTK